MMFMEVIAIYWKIYVKSVDVLCGQNAEYLNIHLNGIYNYQLATKC